MDDLTRRLLATTDAMVWATEFVALFDVTRKDCSPTEGDDAAGLMVGWFANAMCVAEDHAKKRIAEQIVGYPFRPDLSRTDASPETASPETADETDGADIAVAAPASPGTRYQSRPSEVEAVQWTGDNYPAMAEFAGDRVSINLNMDAWHFALKAGVDGVQGWVAVPVGHWIVHQPGDLSDIWPVDPDYFAAKYQLAIHDS